jgi:hypothetical protein
MRTVTTRLMLAAVTLLLVLGACTQPAGGSAAPDEPAPPTAAPASAAPAESQEPAQNRYDY